MRPWIFLLGLLAGCTSISYEHEGTTVTYSAIFKEIKDLQAQVPGGAKIQVGSSNADANGIQAIPIRLQLVPTVP